MNMENIFLAFVVDTHDAEEKQHFVIFHLAECAKNH